MRNFQKILSFALFLAIVYGTTSCQSSEEVGTKGKVNVLVTDAAVDAENISGVYLSVSEVQVKADSEVKTVATFDEPKEFDLMAYQNGSTYALADGEMEVGAYDELRLILTEDNYIKFQDGTTESLMVPSGTSSGYKIKGDFNVASENEVTIVADIDLRKALVVEGSGDYKLRPTARIVAAENTGTIKGSISASDDEQLVVYAYAKGTYDASEAEEPMEGSTRFEGSVNSAVVTNGGFTLAFMEKGEYELVVARYERDATSNRLTFTNTANAEILLNGKLTNVVKVEARSQVNLLLNLNL